MPSKSIGIQFYGKLNPRRYYGVCPHCQTQAALTSYETQRWWGIFAVPLIPLGRRQILDHCPICVHLHALTTRSWQEKKQTDVAAAAQAMKSDPESVAPALHLHERLAAFGRTVEAAELLANIRQRFGAESNAQAYLNNVSRVVEEGPPCSGDSSRFLRFATVSTILILAILAATNVYLAKHRLVHVVNGLEAAVTVAIEGGPTLSVPPGSNRPLQVAEGALKASVTGAVEEQIPFTIVSGIRERWFSGRHYLLNPGGAALLITERSPGSGGQRNYELHVGERFLSLPETDYLFSNFPPSLNTEGGPAKTRLDVVSTPPADLFYALVRERRLPEAMTLGEWELERHPDQTELLSAYINVGLLANQSTRMRDFLLKGTRHRPVRIQWHRVYQSLPQGAAAQKMLVAEYDQLLQAEPGNSALLYLRGRLSDRLSEANPFYEKAIQADAGNAFAHHALGYNAASAGEWAQARSHLARACELRPQDEQMQELYFLSRLALGEFEPLERELREGLTKDPLLLTAVRRLSEVLLATGQTNQVQLLSAEHKSALASRFPGQAESIHAQLAAHIAYTKGDFAAMERVLESEASMQGRLGRFHALVEQARFDEATNAIPLASLGEPLHVMVFALAERRAGRTESATVHQTLAEQRMLEGRPGYLRAAQMLRAPDAPSLHEVLQVTLAPQNKAILLLALAQQFPQSSKDFLPAAIKLNVSREFPHHLIKRLAQ